MAENILGLLLVTSSSRGSYVFRYPPDPLSPSPRLSQPIYPSATFTASDPLHRRAKPLPQGSYLNHSHSHYSLHSGSGFGAGFGLGVSVGGGEERKSSHSLGSRRILGKAFGEGSSDGGSMRARAAGEAGLRAEEEDSEEDNGDVSDESDYEYIWFNGTAIGTGRGSIEAATSSNSAANASESLILPARSGLAPSPGGLADTSSRRSSLTHIYPQPPSTQMRASASDDKPAPMAKTERHRPADSLESQYNSALCYSLDFLSDMLTPPRTACNRKFEICVDELLFIGHPVVIGPGGRWVFPADEDEDRPVMRGRRGRDSAPIGASHLRTVVESGESSEAIREVSGATSNGDEVSRPGRNGSGGARTGPAREKEDGPPMLTMFHLVLILDRPDPKVGATGGEVGTVGIFDEMYREIAFKWTAAAWALQVRDNYIGRESWEMARFRDKCISEGIPIEECCQKLYRINSLERALNDLYLAIHRYQTAPTNPLYAHLPTTITVALADMAVSMVLPPKAGLSDEAWAHWGEMDETSDLSDLDSEDGLGRGLDSFAGTAAAGGKGDLRVEPWQTLLLIEEDAAERAEEMANALIGVGGTDGADGSYANEHGNGVANGNGSRGGEEGGGGDDQSPIFLSARRGSKEQSAEEDESIMMKALIEACDVTKPLADIAHTIRFDLDGIVVPLARELVQNKKAILIDVVNTRLRTVVMPTTIAEHGSSLYDYADRFVRYFPSLPPLPTFISQISASPTPFRDVLPADIPNDAASRQVYLDALLWLLRRDLVVQVHIRVRVWARPEVKQKAWRKLWERRRGRWLAAVKERVRRSSHAGTQNGPEREGGKGQSERDAEDADELELVTPRARAVESDPMENTVPPPNGTGGPASVPGVGNPPTHRSSIASGLNPGAGATAPAPAPAPAPASALDTYKALRATYDLRTAQDYDPDLEADSDLGEGEADGGTGFHDMDVKFSLNQTEPPSRDVPSFEGSFVFRPSRAQKDEARWLRVIRERGDEVWASKFDLCVQHFDGVATFEEIAYRTGLQRRELDWILRLYKEDVVTFLHP